MEPDQFKVLMAQVYAQGIVIGMLLESAPHLKPLLLKAADHLIDAPPLAMSDAFLASSAEHIRALCQAPKA